MNQELQATEQNDEQIAGWIHLVMHLSDAQYLNHSKIEAMTEIFGKVTITADFDRPEELSATVEWRNDLAGLARAERMNAISEASELDWVLFIEDEEEIWFNDFPGRSDMHSLTWCPALICSEQEGKLYQNYHIRMVPSGHKDIFIGKELPDATEFMRSRDIGLSQAVIRIQRAETLYEDVDTEKELMVTSFSPSLYLLMGERYFKEHQFVHAAAQYRRLLKADKLLPFDRLAAVNGLAGCMTEQYKWEKALNLCTQSVEAEPHQRLPYLISYKIHQLQKQWEGAYQALTQYYDRFDLYSRASYDVSIGREETLLNLAELAHKAGLRDKASDHLNELFEIRNGEVDDRMLEQLIILSTELMDKEKAIYYFEQRFSLPGYLKSETGELDEEGLNDMMSMFMQKGWYEYVHRIYSRLYEMNPGNNEYKRRLIVVSMKTNRIDQARDLAVKVA